jgi:osmotically-inducible protein OsmY
MVSPMTDVSQRVLEALQNDSRIKGTLIDVAYNQGVVTLSGQVKTEALREAAEEVARQQGGVVSVINEIKVVPQ